LNTGVQSIINEEFDDPTEVKALQSYKHTELTEIEVSSTPKQRQVDLHTLGLENIRAGKIKPDLILRLKGTKPNTSGANTSEISGRTPNHMDHNFASPRFDPTCPDHD